MVPIPISELISEGNVPVDLYVRLGEENFFKVAKAGSKTDKERLSTYEDKTLEYLWVRKEEYGALVKSSLIIAGIVVQQGHFSLQKKTAVLTAAASAVFRQLGNMGLSLETYSQAKEIVDATVTLAENHSDLHDLFDSIQQCSDELLRHSIAVSAVSVLIAQAMGWDSRSTIEKLALGGLLHDIGKKALPPDLLTKPKVRMTHEELQSYETHSYKGMEMLVSLGIVPDDVISIVYEHHENSFGQGYPRKLRNLKIHPLARIVSLANEFVQLTVPSVNMPKPRSPREALLTIELTMGQPFAKECFKALQQVVAKDHFKKLAS